MKNRSRNDGNFINYQLNNSANNQLTKEQITNLSVQQLTKLQPHLLFQKLTG